MAKKQDIKEEKKEAEDKDNYKLPEKQTRQIFWFFMFLVLLLVVVVSVPFIFDNFINKFDFINLEFQKLKQGDITFYFASIPVADTQGEVIDKYEISFRNDPREVEKIPIAPRIQEEGLKFVKKNTVYISLDPLMNPCEDNSVAMFTLGNFLDNSGLTVKSSFTNKSFAEESRFPYKTCENSASNTIIIVRSGEETVINQERTNCYEIVYKDCEVQQAVERFILVVVEDYMESLNQNEG